MELTTRKLLQRRIRHSELGAEVLAEQVNGALVALRIALRQVLHGLHQQPLAFDIAGVALARLLAPLAIRHHRNDEDLTHALRLAV